MDLPETSVQRPTLLIASVLLTACASQQPPADKQATLLAQPLTPNSLMREGDVINFQVFAPREPNIPFWQTVQFSAACSRPQVNQVYSFMLRRSYANNSGHYAPPTALPERYHATLMNNREFTQACKNLPAPDWRQVMKGDAERWLLLDNSSVRKNGKQVQFWMAYDEPQTRLNPLSRSPFTQTREQYTLDCAARKVTLLARYYLNANNEVTDGKIEMFPEAKAMTAATQDQLKVFELVCNAPTTIATLGPGVLGRHQDVERFVVERQGQDVGFVEWQGDDDRVQLAVAQLVAQHMGEVFFDVQRHLRGDPVQLRNQVREQVRADGVDRADFQRGGQLVLAGLGQFANTLGLLQDLLRLGHDAFAHWSQAHGAFAALENQHTEFVFKLFHAHRQRRLADVATLGRMAEMLLLGEGHDVA